MLGYTVQHTRLLVRQGQLKANKFGRDWLIMRESVAEYKTSKKDKVGGYRFFLWIVSGKKFGDYENGGE